MSILRILIDIEQIIFFLMAFFGLYQVVICLFVFVKEKKKEKIIDKCHKFMAVISARNEEKVIRNLIHSLQEQDYPKDKLDIYVIADNCTDNTAQVAREAGAIVLERFNETKKSKGYALECFFDQMLAKNSDEYDAFCIFDADNIVSKSFISKMNDKLCEGEKIVQGYRDIKNAGDTWVTANYAIFYWMMNRFYHYTRYKLGLSPLINGTGFMVAMSVIKETNGWHTETLTEDIEFSLQSIARGYTIGWAHDAVVYDEQPLGFKQSWTQRMRWSVGHIQCFKTCTPFLISQQNVTATLIDAVIYLFGMPFVFLSGLMMIFNIIKYMILPLGVIRWISNVLFWNVITAVAMILQALLTTIIEKKDIKKVWKGIVTYPVFMFSWLALNALAFFNKKLEWKQIAHVRSIDVKELQ